MYTSCTGKGVATTYNLSIIMIHGADLICLTGICNFTLPIKPDLISIGNPKFLSAFFFNGKFSNSTSPKIK